MKALSVAGFANCTLTLLLFVCGFSIGLAQAGQAQLSVNNASVPEGNSGTTNLDFSVVRSGDSSSNIVVPYRVTPGTATAGVDYIAPAAGSVLRIPAGLIQGIIGVPVIGDTTIEPDETLQLQLSAPSAYNPQADFLVAPTIAVGHEPRYIVSADFNGDGRLDLAVHKDENVSILLGLAGGGFSAPTDVVTGAGNGPLAAADFNGDGKTDLAVVDGSGNIEILLGNGHGQFSAPTSFAAGGFPVSLAVADFNHDGKPDLAIANASRGGDVSVLLGDGHGGFGTATHFSAGSTFFGVSSVITADFNGDGNADIAATPDTNKIAILLGDGHGGFQPFIGIPAIGAGALAVADFNGDGKPDLAATNGLQVNVSILIGNGQGGFTVSSADIGNTPDTFTASPIALGSADFNGDGKADLAVLNQGSNNVSILPGDGHGGFGTAKVFGVGGLPVGITIGDFDADGKPDLAATSASDDNVSILRNQGGAKFAAAANFAAGSGPRSVATADFNGDGKLDLVVADQDFGDVAVLLGNAGGGFDSAVHFDTGTRTSAVASADFNHDGLSDVAVTDQYDNNVSILLGDGHGSLGSPAHYKVGTSPQSVAVADFNGDGQLDLAVANHDSNNVSILLGKANGGFGAAKNLAVGSGPQSVAALDLNGDGQPDLAVANSAGNNVSILLGDGHGGFGAVKNFAAGNGPAAVALADLNGDGKPDLAVADFGVFGAGTVSVLLGDGHGGFGAAQSFAVGNGPDAITVVDVNGDGKPDLAVTNSTDSTVSILLGNGSGGFAAAVNFAAGKTPEALAAGDFNGDGKPDLAVADYDGNFIALLLNSPAYSALLSNASATGTIINDDQAAPPPPLPKVTLSASPLRFSAKGGSATVTASLDAQPNRPVVIQLGFSGSAQLGTDYSVYGNDYVASANSIVILGGRSGSVTLTGLGGAAKSSSTSLIGSLLHSVIGIIQGLLGDNKTITVKILEANGGPEPATIGLPNTVTLTLTDSL